MKATAVFSRMGIAALVLGASSVATASPFFYDFETDSLLVQNLLPTEDPFSGIRNNSLFTGNLGNSWESTSPYILTLNFGRYFGDQSIGRSWQTSDFNEFAFSFSRDFRGANAVPWANTFEMDLRTTRSDNATAPLVVVMSSTGMLILERQIAASSTMQSYSFDMTPSAGWYFNRSPYFWGTQATPATEEQIRSVLVGLRWFGVSSDFATGDDEVFVDNVGFRPVPTPGAAGLLMAGAVMASRRRRA
jgi:hypothetical protein